MPVPTRAIFNFLSAPKLNDGIGKALAAASMLTDVKNVRLDGFIVSRSVMATKNRQFPGFYHCWPEEGTPHPPIGILIPAFAYQNHFWIAAFNTGYGSLLTSLFFVTMGYLCVTKFSPWHHHKGIPLLRETKRLHITPKTCLIHGFSLYTFHLSFWWDVIRALRKRNR